MRDEERGEVVCRECGLVVSEAEVDRGPEGRAYDSEEEAEKSRVGAPTTELLHDRGLSTDVGWRDEDAYGLALSPRQRERTRRLRTWNERFRTRTGTERGLKRGVAETDRMASALGLSADRRGTASLVFRRARDADLPPGRSVEGLAAAAVYAAALDTDEQVTHEAVNGVTDVSTPTIRKRYQELLAAADGAEPSSGPGTATDR